MCGILDTEGDTMTSTALGLPTPPCRTQPDLWSESHTNAEAKRLCRQCWRRFTCAADVLKDRNTISRLQGVVAGVGIPPQNDYGTSKSRRQALNQLHAVAAIGRRLGVDGPDRPRPAARPAQTLPAAGARPAHLSARSAPARAAGPRTVTNSPTRSETTTPPATGHNEHSRAQRPPPAVSAGCAE